MKNFRISMPSTAYQESFLSHWLLELANKQKNWECWIQMKLIKVACLSLLDVLVVLVNTHGFLNLLKYFYFSMFLMNVIRLSFYEPLLLLTICIEFYNNLSIKLFFLQSRVAILLINLLFEHLDKKTENLYSLERL